MDADHRVALVHYVLLFDKELFTAAGDLGAVGTFAGALDVIADLALQNRLHHLHRRRKVLAAPSEQLRLVGDNDSLWFDAEADDAARQMNAAPRAELLRELPTRPALQ